MTQTSYCPICRKNVMTNRGKFSYLLAFLLALTGIGLIVYILYYIDRKPNYCVHCGTVCKVPKLENQIEQEEYQKASINTKKMYYCPYCGEKLEREYAKFCYKCGSKI